MPLHAVSTKSQALVLSGQYEVTIAASALETALRASEAAAFHAA
jgi:hypothetical protein